MRVAVILFTAYVLVLFKLLFFKVRLVFSTIDISGNESATLKMLYDGSNFVPFSKIYYYASGQEPYLVGALNIFGNILLFVPMGFFLALFFKRINTAARLTAVVALISLVVEILQLLTRTGEFDIDDVILNTSGGWLGYLAFKTINGWTRRNKKTGSNL